MKVDNVTLPKSNLIAQYTNKSKTSNVNIPKIDKHSKSLKVAGVVAGVALAALAGVYLYKKLPKNLETTINEYKSQLAKGLEECTGKKVSAESLSCVVDKNEFLESVSKLKKENYVASKENIEKGIFRADLHSHTTFSDGKGTVESILKQVCDYADALHKKTGEKFLFAFTDHDSIEGTKKALEIISETPEQFKNVKFATGAELSYLLKSDKSANPCETSELLAYCFNPFDKNVSKFFDDLKNKRLTIRKNYIEELSKTFPQTKFSEGEFVNVFLGDNAPRSLMMNSTWKIFHYGQIKTVLSDTAKAKGLEPENYFAQTMKKAPKNPTLFGLKENGLVENWINENPKIAEINKKYLPEIDSFGEIVEKGENTIENIAKAFNNDGNCVVGFAHPYFISERTADTQGVISKIKSKLGNILKVTESYHQAYPIDIKSKHALDIDSINKLCEGEKLIPIGGRDNHLTEWLPK